MFEDDEEYQPFGDEFWFIIFIPLDFMAWIIALSPLLSFIARKLDQFFGFTP